MHPGHLFASRQRLIAAGAASMLFLAACSGDGDYPEPTVDPSVESQARQAPEPDLSAFYDQDLSWEKCEGGQCATLTVPVDYEDPDGETIELPLKRVMAKDKDKRQGALVVNPGGPGASGTEFAGFADFVLSPDARDAFDLVGFDPRGVGGSSPVECLSDEALDDFMGSDPTPDDAKEEEAHLDAGARFARSCEVKSPELVPFLGSVNVVKDMDVLRAALKEPKLNYLGFSYGTSLGQLYADAYPKKVGRFVLDGALPVGVEGLEIGRGQARGFERATRSFAQWCVDEGNCPMGSSADEVLSGIQTLLKDLDAKPIPTNADGDSVKELTEGWASYGIAAGMYAKEMWPQVRTGLERAKAGDGQALMQLANDYAARDGKGGYKDNSMEAFYAISCADQTEGDAGDPAEETRDAAKELSKESPTWGQFMAWGNPVCHAWPEPNEPMPTEAKAEGADPILVIGTTRDPATPFEWSEQMANDLDSGVLLKVEGDGHTAYRGMAASECVLTTVDYYLVRGEDPKKGASC